MKNPRPGKSRPGRNESLFFQIAEQVLLVDAIRHQFGKTVNDSLLVLGIGDAEPLVVGGQNLDGNLALLQQLVDVDGQQIFGFQRIGGGRLFKEPASSRSTKAGVRPHIFIETRLSTSMALPPAAAPSAVFSIPLVSSTPVR